MMQQAKSLLGLSVCLCLVGAGKAHSELKPMDDAAMSEMVGQAAVAFNVVEASTGENFTRFTLGLDTEMQMNIDSVVLGEYVDANETTSADFLANNLSFGHISRDAARIQIDGNSYAVGEIVPFLGIDPYFELAEVGGEIVGFRVGFNQARGTISSDLSSFSGNIGLKVDMDGTGADIRDAQLLNDSGLADNNRATHIGIEDAAGCAATCASLANLGSLEVGEDLGGAVGFTKNFFVSFQKQSVNWMVDPNDVSAAPATVTTTSNTFINIPTAMTVNMLDLQNGIARERTEYIDRGLGLF